MDLVLLFQHNAAVKLTLLYHGPVQLRLGAKTFIQVIVSLERPILHVDGLIQATDTASSFKLVAVLLNGAQVCS